MSLGDPKDWTDHFRSMDTRFLERISAVWAQCVALLSSDAGEDKITINLVKLLSNDAEARRLFHYIEYQYEPFRLAASGAAYSLGKIDMAVLLDSSRERYLAYECKRLNVVRDGRTHSLATLYVREGVCRFVTEQYAAGLPMGCMLGYVMDGDAEAAQLKVTAAMETHKGEIGLVADPVHDDPMNLTLRFSSRHHRRTRKEQIEIRHALLPFR